MERTGKQRDIALDEDQLKLLQEIDEGVRQFEPPDDSYAALMEFQVRVKNLRFLERRRLITEISGLNMRIEQKVGVFDRVRIKGGLTDKGKRLLVPYEETIES